MRTTNGMRSETVSSNTGAVRMCLRRAARPTTVPAASSESQAATVIRAAGAVCRLPSPTRLGGSTWTYQRGRTHEDHLAAAFQLPLASRHPDTPRLRCSRDLGAERVGEVEHL